MDTSTNAAPPPMFSSESPPVKHRRSRTLTPNSRTREGIHAFACMCLSYHHMYLRRLLESWTCPNCRSGGQMANRTPQFSPSFGFLSLSLSHTNIIPYSHAECKQTVASAVQLMLCCQMLGGYCVLVVAVLVFVFHFFDGIFLISQYVVYCCMSTSRLWLCLGRTFLF